MQPAHNVQFCDPEGERFACFVDDFFYGVLKSIGVALLSRKGAELAAQYAVVGVVEIAVNDVAGAVACFAIPRHVRQCPHCVEVLFVEKAHCLGVGNPLAGCHFVIDAGQVPGPGNRTHAILLADWKGLATELGESWRGC